ncbi:unnamed protein product [Amoebophrya sp. A25]|nr:unnamed protein product [Amoebophrya sp. A25]|eukprot:GSA25T00026042001.1
MASSVVSSWLESGASATSMLQSGVSAMLGSSETNTMPSGREAPPWAETVYDTTTVLGVGCAVYLVIVMSGLMRISTFVSTSKRLASTHESRMMRAVEEHEIQIAELKAARGGRAEDNDDYEDGDEDEDGDEEGGDGKADGTGGGGGEGGEDKGGEMKGKD